MPEFRNATRFRLVNAILSWLFGLAFIAGGFYCFWEMPEGSDKTLLMVLYIVASGLALGIFITLRYRHFSCPQCGGKVVTIDTGIEGDPALKTCKRCETTWKIGTI